MRPGKALAAILGRALVFASLASLLTCALLPAPARADDVPPRPTRYFNDSANVVDAGTAEELNNELANFERQTSNQIVVAVYPKMASDDGLDMYCYRIAQAWGVGQKDKNNGAVLFVFVQDHKMNIQTGYGLEGALPDAICKDIIADKIAPRFKQGDYAGGLRAGIQGIMAATKGEYKGSGRTRNDQVVVVGDNTVFFVILGIIILLSLFRRTRGILYSSNGFGSYGGWSSGGSGGGGFSGGGGGFSSGGGSFGGGGASGSW